MRSRWLFFWLFCSLATPGRFIPIFYAAHGITASQIGIILSILSLISFISTPLFCNLADRTNRENVTIYITWISVALFALQALAFPAFHILSPQLRFPALLLSSIFLGFVYFTRYALVSAISISQLRTLYGHKGHERFGQERLWGAVSWALSSMILGIVLDIPSVDMSIVYIGNFVTGVGLIMVLSRFSKVKAGPEHQDETIALLYNQEIQEFNPPHTSGNTSTNAFSMSPLAVIPQLLASGAATTIMFFNMYFWVAVGMGLVERLVFIYFTQDLHASNTLCGVSVIITVIFEIPLFAVAPDLLEYFGVPNLAILGALSYVVRVVAYTLAPNPWVMLVFEPLHGFTFAAVSTASVAFIAERVAPRLEATGQSLLNMIQSLAVACGTAVGGFVIEKYGSRVLYQGAAICVLVASLCFTAVERLAREDKQVRAHAESECLYTGDANLL